MKATAEEASKVKGEMKAACSKELYELAKGAFLHTCGGDQTEAVCQCTFAALEKKYGKDKVLAVLEAGGDDMQKAFKSVSKTCGAK